MPNARHNPEQKFVIHYTRAPGDVLMLTALVRDLKLTYGDRYAVMVRTKFPDLWRHNPHLDDFDPAEPDVQTLHMGGNTVGAADRAAIIASRSGESRRHYCTAFHTAFERLTGISVPCTRPHADIHLTAEEKATPYVTGPYWLIVPGGKTDTTTKWWLQSRWQEVAHRLRQEGFQVVQDGALKPIHVHKPLRFVHSMVGSTCIRDLIRNIYHASGVICGCTLQMHIAGALEKPAVILLGGREEPSFEAYNNDYDAFGPDATPVKVEHKVLHTFGQMDCCETSGCWARRVVPLHDNQAQYDKKLCKYPIYGTEEIVAKCMNDISVDEVVEAALAYGLKSFKTEKHAAFPPLDAFTTEPELHRVLAAQPDVVSDEAKNIPETPEQLIRRKKQKVGRHNLAIVLVLEDDKPQVQAKISTNIAGTADVHDCELYVVHNRPSEQGRIASGLLREATIIEYRHKRSRRDILQTVLDEVASPWMVWVNDTVKLRSFDWLNAFAQAVASVSPDAPVGLIGNPLVYELTEKAALAWFSRSPWFNSRPWCGREGQPVEDGRFVHFVNPAFCAINVEGLRAAGGADPRVSNVGLDIVIGAQLYQQGLGVKALNTRQELAAVPRPVYVDQFPWA